MEDDIEVEISMDDYQIWNYSGLYDHDRVTDLVENMEDALDQIRDQIKDEDDMIKCHLIWTPDEEGKCADGIVRVTAPGYYELEFISGSKYPEPPPEFFEHMNKTES